MKESLILSRISRRQGLMANRCKKIEDNVKEKSEQNAAQHSTIIQEFQDKIDTLNGKLVTANGKINDLHERVLILEAILSGSGSGSGS